MSDIHATGSQQWGPVSDTRATPTAPSLCVHGVDIDILECGRCLNTTPGFGAKPYPSDAWATPTAGISEEAQGVIDALVRGVRMAGNTATGDFEQSSAERRLESFIASLECRVREFEAMQGAHVPYNRLPLTEAADYIIQQERGK